MNQENQIARVLYASRQRLQLSGSSCAARCGLSVEGYRDVEAEDCEFLSNISMGTARRICQTLKLDLLDLVSDVLKISGCSASFTEDEEYFSRHDMVSVAREEKKLSVIEVADAIGYGTLTVELLEQTPDFIECLTITDVMAIAGVTDIHPARLICRRPYK
jgi:transcriptional regulator with XRE-family HTH domain